MNVTVFCPRRADEADSVDAGESDVNGCVVVWKGRCGDDSKVELGGGVIVVQEEKIEPAISVEVGEHGTAVGEGRSVWLGETRLSGDVVETEWNGEVG